LLFHYPYKKIIIREIRGFRVIAATLIPCETDKNACGVIIEQGGEVNIPIRRSATMPNDVLISDQVIPASLMHCL